MAVSSRFILAMSAVLGVIAGSAYYLLVPHYSKEEETKARRAGFTSAQTSATLIGMAESGNRTRGFSEKEFTILSNVLDKGTTTDQIYALTPFQHVKELKGKQRVLDLLKPHLKNKSLQYQVYDILYSFAESENGRPLIVTMSKDNDPDVAQLANKVLVDTQPTEGRKNVNP